MEEAKKEEERMSEGRRRIVGGRSPARSRALRDDSRALRDDSSWDEGCND